MNGDKLIRAAMSAVVVAVAGFAAVVSYSHIFGLGRAHGQDGAAARLLPLSHAPTEPQLTAASQLQPFNHPLPLNSGG